MLDIQAEAHDAGQHYQDLYEAVVDLKRRHDLHPCAVRPRDGLSLRDEGEREQVQDLVVRFRRLPEETRRKLPALWNSLAQLEVVVGDLDASLADFQEVARIVSDPISIAEAHHNVHCAALERGDWDTALTAMKRAVALDPETFEPFPLARFEPLRILGGGGLGPSYLCRQRDTGHEVVVKTLRADSLDRDAASLFRDASAMRDLDHPALVGVLAMGHGGADSTRPYLVLEYVEGRSLAEVVFERGSLPPEEWLEIAWPVLRALQALHGRGLVHRAVRPGAVLLRRVKNRDGATVWGVKLLDAGLAPTRAVIHASASVPEAARGSGVGRTVARLIPYSPPEVVGRPKGQVWVGPHSDLYSFGKLCAFALTGRPNPDAADCLLLPEGWQKLLDDCTGWTINRRPAQAGVVLDQIAHLPGADTLVARIERDLHESAVEALTARIEAAPKDAEAFAQRGAARFKQGDFDGAVGDYNEAIELKPEDATLRRRRAQAYTRAERHADAIADYTESLRLEPRHLEAIANRGLAHAQLGEHGKAIADYTEGLRLNPHDEVLFYNRGNAHYYLGEYALAVADYTEALRLDPRNLWTLGNRGKAYMLWGDPGRAAADFTRLLQLDPSNVKTLCDRASTHLDLGRYDRALADYTEALRLQPTAGLYHDRGLAHARAGELAKAVADFTEALSLSNDNAAVLISRGKAHADLKQYDQALADLAEALRIAPRGTNALAERAAVQLSQGRPDLAVADLTAAIEVSPEPSLYFQRGLAQAHRGEHDGAVADFSEVIRRDPNAAVAYTNRGASFMRLGELDRAMDDFNQALALAPNNVGALVSRADARVQVGDLDAALTDFGEVLRLDPANAGAYTSRAKLLMGRGELNRALDDLDVAVWLQPDDARTRNLRGSLHAERGLREKAITDFSEALRLAPDYAPAWYNRGVARAEEGRLAEAVADFTEVLRLDPSLAAAILNRGIVYRRSGDRDKALADFAAAIHAEPTLAAAYYNRGGLLAEAGDHAGAVADFDRLLELAPGDVEAYIARGRVHALAGAFDRAVADNLAALERTPGDPRVANNLAWLLATAPEERLRDPVRAVEFARQAVANGEDATRLDTLAAALAAGGQFAEAIEAQRRAIDLASEADRDELRARMALYEQAQPYVQRSRDGEEPSGAGP